MKKYLKYELKKNLWAFVIIAVICTISYVVEVSEMDMIWSYENEGVINTYIQPSGLSTMQLYLTFLTLIVPVLTYSFKMNKRSVDAYYALPIQREKLYLVKTIIGLFLVLAPFTIAYWSGFLTLLLRSGNPYAMGWYAPAYFGLVALGTLLYGFNSFIFTRANKVGDGVVFMLAYGLLGGLAYSYLVFGLEIIPKSKWWIEQSFYSWGGMYVFTAGMDCLIRLEAPSWSVVSFIYPIITGVLGYVLLFRSLRKEKAENAEQISDTPYGYKMLIPTYAAFILGESLSMISFVLIAEIVATVVYQRKFKFGKKEWLRIGIGLALGVFLNLIK